MASSNGCKGVSSPVKGEKTIKPNWSQGITIFQIVMFVLEIYGGGIFGRGCILAFKYGGVYRISPSDQELLKSWGVFNYYPQLLIDAFIVSFFASMLIQGLILAIPVIQLRKREFLKKSYFSTIVMLVLYLDSIFGILLWSIAKNINPTSKVISALFSFIPAGIIIGGLIAKVIVNLVPLAWGYIALLGFNDKTPYIIKHKFSPLLALKDGKTVAELILVLLGIIMMTQTVIVGKPALEEIIEVSGLWLVLCTLFWHWYRIRKKARKKGKEVFI